MTFDLMLLPDLIAMAALSTLLFVVRRSYRRTGFDAWMMGLALLFLEILFHAFYKWQAPYWRPLHALMLDCYALAGLSFLYAATAEKRVLRPRLPWLAVAALPYLAALSAFGYEIKSTPLYFGLAVAGLVLGLAAVSIMDRTWWNLGGQLIVWVPLGIAAYRGDIRVMSYGGLFFIYAMVAFAFSKSLPSRGWGKTVIVTGFSSWALVFLTHPMTAQSRLYSNLSNLVWDMQKFIIVIGMLVVLLEEQLEKNRDLALHDGLTGLPNRRLFDDRLLQAAQHSIRTGRPTALFAIDLNRFKRINDTLGHQAGDELLCIVGERLQKALRITDTVARMGGDEFSVIATDLADESIMLRVLGKVVSVFQEPVLINKKEVLIAGAVGMAMFPSDTNDLIDLQGIADDRMYQNKRFQAEALVGARVRMPV